ncbi:MAG: hypothetical protein ACD_79C00709G0003 [uncultured bacterium]|nr:MAG: hypothetical protein ACD_79C00709G0003 [uncultured bacterium]
MTEEKRSDSRIKIDLPVKLKCSDDLMFMAATVSINSAGFLCSVKKSLPFQSKVDIIILIPPFNEEVNKTSSVFKCQGIVVRENITETLSGDLGHAVAVKFIDPAENDLKKLIEYLQYLSSINEKTTMEQK